MTTRSLAIAIRKILATSALAGSLALAPQLAASAEDSNQDDSGEGYAEPFRVAANLLPVEHIYIVGSRENAQEIPGSATYIGEQELEIFEYDDIHRILREVPGVYIQEEDGFGLRPNIGLRGSGTDRSSTITLMEDGVLIAPAPYAAPAAYYFPTAGRMEAVEVRKGSSSIKFGPRTTGGAINLISTSIPDDPSGQVTARFGSFGHKEVHANAGGTSGPYGILLETFQVDNNGFKQLPSGSDTGFRIEDYLAKFRADLAGEAGLDHSIEFKIGLTNQVSDETYLGLTDEDFAENPFQRYAASENDQFRSKHWQVQATHYVQLSQNADLTTIAYYNEFSRDWFKLDDLDFGDGRGRISPRVVFADPDDPLNIAAIAILKGEADSVDDAIQLRHNARTYYSTGVQSVLGLDFETGAASHNLEIGFRYHADQEDRQQNREKFKMENGVLVPTSIDPPASQANRLSKAHAFATFVQDTIRAGNFIVTPGVRVEVIELERFDFSTADPDRLLGPTQSRSSTVTAVIPGIGAAYLFESGVTLFAGIHRGFAPPAPGQTDAREEESINVEAGVRYQTGGLFIEAIGFYNDYDNLLGTCTASVGCTVGEFGDQFNGGKVEIKGLELAARERIEVGQGMWIPLKLAYTLTKATFESTFESNFDLFGDVQAGDELPYIPRHQLTVSAGLEGEKWGAIVLVNYQSVARDKAGSGPIPQLERIDPRTIVDLALHYELSERVRIFFTIENLFDEVYVAARQPYGARPGKPRAFFGGLTANF